MSLPFHVEDSTTYPNHKTISIDEKVYELIGGGISGSYNILFPRLFGLSYAEFMRYVRDKYNATLHGKNSGYITFTFKNISDANNFNKEIVVRWVSFLDVKLRTEI